MSGAASTETASAAMSPVKTRSLRGRLLGVDAIGVAAVVAVAAGAYLLGIEPVADARAEIEEKRRLIEEQTRNAADAESLLQHENARLGELKKQLDAVKVRLAPAAELNKRLDVIAGLVEGHGLVIQSMDPGTPSTDPELGKFSMVPIRLAGAGTFAGVSGFLHELLANKYPDVEVRAMNLASVAAGAGAASPGASEKAGVPAAPAATFALELRWYAAPAVSAGAEHGR